MNTSTTSAAATTAATLIIRFLDAQPGTVKQIAEATLVSESRVREILKELDVVSTGKPAVYTLTEESVETLAASPTLAPANWNFNGRGIVQVSANGIVPTEAAASEPSDSTPCPACQSLDTVLGGPEDSVVTCKACGKAHNVFTQVEVPAKAAKGKRVLLNPQYKINAKLAAVEAVGGTLTYSKQERLWTVEIGEDVSLLSAQDFSALTPETIVLVFAAEVETTEAE